MTRALRGVALAAGLLLGGGVLFAAYVASHIVPPGAWLELFIPEFIKRQRSLNFTAFYRVNVQLTYENEPLDIEIIVACASESRQILGEARSARAIYAPYMFGVRVRGGHGVLVQSPNICWRDFQRFPVPDDYLPIVFWAPDAANLEFLVAYLHERAYSQPISKLRFVRATIAQATEADHLAWRAGKWKENIIPLADRYDDQFKGISYFRGGAFFPAGDIRVGNALGMATTCHSFVRIPIPSIALAELAQHRPRNAGRYWLLEFRIADELRRRYGSAFVEEARSRHMGTLSDIAPNSLDLSGALGIARPSGIGHLAIRGRNAASGEATRIPFRIESGYPWINDRLKDRSSFDLNLDTDGGADQGFSYCFREVNAGLFRDSTDAIIRRDHHYFVDGVLVGTFRDRGGQIGLDLIVERDQFFWRRELFNLNTEVGRFQ